MKNFKLYVCGLLAVTAALLTGCSGGGSSNTGAGVTFSLPSGVDVLKVDTSGSSSLDYTDPTSDYSKATQNFHVSHPVGEALSTTSSIMCFIGQLGIEDMWEEASLPRVYLVAVDDGKCDSEANQPSQGAASGGSDSSATPAIVMVTVRLSREAPGLYPRAEIWFSEEDGDSGTQDIRASIDVIESPNANRPYGAFNLYFSMLSGSTVVGGGNLIVSGTNAAPITYSFFEKHTNGGQTMRRAASVEMQADGSGLKAGVQTQSPWDGNSAWVVATSNSSVLANNKQSDGTTPAGSVDQVALNGGICLSTEDFSYRIHGYGLYTENEGDKVELSTGISCQYTDSSSKTRNCHVGRHGVWFERESNGSEHTFANGDTVIRRAWGDDAVHNGDELTLFVSTGRMNKYTVKKYTLAQIRGVEMRMFDNSDNTEYLVKYLTAADDGVGSDGFYKVGEMEWSENGPPSKDEYNSASYVSITINNDEFKWFYAETMGGSVTFVGGKTFVTARIEELLAPGNAAFSGGELDLKCINRCPKAPISQANLTTWGGPYETDPANKAGALDYVVKESDMTLRKGTNVSDPQVALDTGVSFSHNSSVHQWGVESGAMLDAAAYAGITNLGDIYNTEGAVYYQYRMGPNNWDKLVLAKDGSTFLEFDDPIAFDYTHSTANDRNGDSTYNGKKFLLRYHGEGHLDGFPWNQVDRDGDGNTDMWFPQVSLKDNVQLTANSVNYRIKALYGDLTLNASTGCGSINLTRPANGVPTDLAGTPSNSSTSKPDHGSCQYDSSTTSAVGCD